MWGQLLGIGAKLAMGALKGAGQSPETGSGFTDTGWTQGNKGPVEPVVLEPLTEPQEPIGKMESVNNWMGSDIGKAATDVAGGFLSDYRSQRNSKKNYQRLQDEGLTAVEIAGGGSQGGSVRSQGNTLGSGPAVQAKSQQAFQADQAEKNRRNQREVALISAQAGRTQAGVAERRDVRDAEMAPKMRQKIDAERRRIEQETKRSKFDLKNVWALTLAHMSEANVKAALSIFNVGLDPRRILQAKGATERELKQIEQVFNLMQKLSGGAGQKVGYIQLIKALLKGEGTMGRESDMTRRQREADDEYKGAWKKDWERNK